MRLLLPLLVLVSLATAIHAASPILDGISAPQWKACTGWVTNAPAKYGVSNEQGTLVFGAEGPGTEMPWIANLDALGFSGDERYLLVHYRAQGLATPPGAYFFHGEEGSYGGRTYATADEIQSDGQWHTLAVDLLGLDILEITHHLAIKVVVGPTGSARLEIGKLWSANSLPADAKLARLPGQKPVESVALRWPAATVLPRTGWTPTPATEFSAMPEGDSMTFAVRGAAKQMRWLAALPQPVDLGRLPYVSVRYKASGALNSETYAIWLGDQESGSGGHSIVALPASDLKVDGAWHNVNLKLAKAFTATHLAVGVNSAGDEAELTLDTVTFASRPAQWALAQVLPYEVRTGPYHGADGFTATPTQITGGSGSPFLAKRLGLKDWFTTPEITVNDVPFVVATDPAQISQTATSDFDTLSMKLAPGAKEVYLLTAAVAPPTEPWGLDYADPRPIETLDVPEKVFYEIRYASGPADRVLPLDVQTGQWGMKRGLSVTVVHPDPTRKATELVLSDRMQTASFAIVGATMLQGTPRVTEANWKSLSYAPPPANALAKATSLAPLPAEPATASGVLQASFATDHGLTWSDLQISGMAGALRCASGPVFEVSVGGKTLPPADWTLEKMEPVGAGRRFILRNVPASLTATVECVPGQKNELLMRMSLRNDAAAQTTATLHFPMLSGLTLGRTEDTWYLSGKRGGIINSASASFRDPLGERHPLQMDGFFNPASGAALACLTHDTVAQHHFVNLSKSSDGGAWAPEYVDRDIAPGQDFEATEAALVLREGDWRAIFAAYNEWLKTWFQRASPPKPWFERIFAVVTGNNHYDVSSDPKVRGQLQPLVDSMLAHVGICDYVHLFGWGASKTYGDWGDYDHYEEVGGLEYFRDNIAKVQNSGRAVSLYLDGFLNSEKGQFSGAHAKEWAMKHPDGSPQFVPEYQSYNECPFMQGWRDYLSSTYARVQRDLAPQVMYIDEIGATDGRWTCWAKDHGHSGHEIPYTGEVQLLKQIREAVGPKVALYTEYPPADAGRRYTDGSITYQALWSVDEEPLAPHFIDLPRFAFPDFKQLHIIYYVPNRAGNWWLLKFPFFNGEVYRIGAPNLNTMDAPSLAFLKRAEEVQCAHRDAFSSPNVQPLVPTLQPGVFANRFSSAGENVWTLYNANGRSVRTAVLSVKHAPGAVYEDAWSGKAIVPRIAGAQAELAVELGPKGTGCVVQRLPKTK